MFKILYLYSWVQTYGAGFYVSVDAQKAEEPSELNDWTEIELVGTIMVQDGKLVVLGPAAEDLQIHGWAGNGHSE